MTDFVHLHVASGFSMRYAASTPAALIDRAAALGQPALALTDRDGLYGAVRFVQACSEAGIAPVLGVDLAVEPEFPLVTPPAGGLLDVPAGGRRRPRSAPVRGGAWVDDGHPRVTVLARGQAAGLPPGVGWARLCRLVTDTHLRGERGAPVSTAGLIAGRARDSGDADGAAGALTVLLGPDSEVGRAVRQCRAAQARALLRRWRDRLPDGSLAVELVCHGGPPGTAGSVAHAARMWGLAREEGVPVVLTAAVRHADPGGAVTVDVLDAARRMVPLDTRHLDRVTSAGHLASAEQMYAVARRVAEAMGTGAGAAGGGPVSPEGRARALLADTVALARHCEQDPRADLGIGSVHLPEPAVLGLADDEDAQAVLAQRCRAAVGTRYAGVGDREVRAVQERLEEELQVIARLGYPTYFMTVATVCDLIRDMGVRVAARGSGAGSMVNYLLGISGVEPMRHGLLMERFCSPLRAQLPDIDVDVESARRTEIYERVLERFGGDRVTCVSMMDTYRVRHAIRDVAATLGMPPAEIDAVAKAFPHIRARDARAAIRELPELRASGLAAPRLQLLFELVERLDGLPRHIALHPCGVVLSNRQLLDRTPVEASWLGFPMSQFDKDDVEALGLLKLDVLGVRMQSAMAHATAEVARVEQVEVDLDDRAQVPLDDPAAFELVRSTRTLGCFQIESPGQRELVGKFGPETFEDLIIDISLFRPGPVKSDMVTPFLQARQGWRPAEYLHPTLVPALQDTHGVVVFHEQVLQIVSETTGVTLAQADEVRRALGSPEGQEAVEHWWRPAARARGYAAQDVERIWSVLKAFASFGFCKAHAAAFALPTYQSAWLKAHHPAAFFAGVLTHDPGMYPKRLILDDARNFGIAVLGLDVNASVGTYRVEVVEAPEEGDPDGDPGDPDGELGDPGPVRHGIRLSLADVKGISEDEVQRIVDGQPYASLADFWQRARVSRPVVERLAMAGGFDSLYGIRALTSGGDAGGGLGRRGRITRRDLLLHIAELDRWSRATRSGSRSSARSSARSAARLSAASAAAGDAGMHEVTGRAAAQARGRRPGRGPQVGPTQLTLDLGDEPTLTATTGLPEMTGPELVRAELDILGLDASAHVVDFYAPLLDGLGVTRSARLLRQRNQSEVLVAGVKVATQTPPVRSGRRVVFLTLDDATGPVDATFFEDVQGPYAATVFHSWMLLVRGIVRRTGPRGISVRATGAWELSALWDAWCRGGTDAALAALAEADAQAWARAQEGLAVAEGDHEAVAGAAESRSTRPVMATPSGHRVLVHASGFRQSPYADVAPAGDSVRSAPRKLWHASPGSSGQ